MKKWILPLCLLLPTISYALVDYSEDSVSFASSATERRPTTKKAVPKSISKRVQRPSARSSAAYSPSGAINFKVSRSVLTTETGTIMGDGTFAMTKFQTHIQTPYNIFLDADYWIGSYDNYTYMESAGTQAGNVNLKLGFNWLKFGSEYDMATINFYFGSRFKGGDSELAVSRDDKLVGIETAKKFLNFSIGFAYEYAKHSKPSVELETILDKTHKLATAISWQATNDIRFLTEASFYKIITASGNNLQFSSLTQRLDLTLSPVLGLELGGIFRMKKASTGMDLYSAKLWDLEGAYGNSIFATLRLSL